MLKRLSLAFAGLFAFVQVALGAGTIPGISMTQQLDQYAHPLSGGLLYLIQAGTTSTPQNCYQDTALTIPWANPVTLDAAGRVPQLICADGSIKIRLTDKNGVQQLVQDNILIIGASSGSGGGGTVDPTTILATGDIKVTYGTGSLSGFVRANGRTIGSATSGATERANLDTQALFEYLWGADANLTVSGGRGASAAADWAANKTLTLPDFRGRVMAGLDDMGNSAAGRRTTTYSGVDGTVLGSATTFTESRALTLAQLPTGITSANTASVALSVTSNNFITSSASDNTAIGTSASDPTSGITLPKGTASNSKVGSAGTLAIGAAAVTSNNTSGASHSIIDPTIFVTTYLKL